MMEDRKGLDLDGRGGGKNWGGEGNGCQDVLCKGNLSSEWLSSLEHFLLLERVGL